MRSQVYQEREAGDQHKCKSSATKDFFLYFLYPVPPIWFRIYGMGSVLPDI